MKEYNFRETRKITVWENTDITITADSEEEAKKILKDYYADQEHSLCPSPAHNIERSDPDTDWDTAEEMEVCENCGMPTVETFFIDESGDEETVYTND